MGGKTGTAQKVGPNGAYMQGNYILSFLVAAPMVGDIFEQILPILDVKKDYKNQIEKELRWFIDTPYHNVPNFISTNKSKIKTSPYYKYFLLFSLNPRNILFLLSIVL